MKTRIEESLGVSFSPEQWEVVTSTDGAMSVIASAGSGKTTTMVARLLYLELAKSVKPYHFLVLTFSKKAAVEIEERYQKARKKLDLPSYRATFSTFHAFYLSCIRQLSGYESLTVVEQWKYFSRLSSVLPRNYTSTQKQELVMRALNTYSFCLNNQINHENPPNDKLVGGLSKRHYLSIVGKYVQLKQENNEIDFDDMQHLVHQNVLAGDKSEILEEFRLSYRYVLVDEFQDVSSLQYDILEKMVNVMNQLNLTVIGDDDQCIYEFRGASPRYLCDFVYCFPDAKRYFLPTNYRCPKKILEFAAPSIERNQNRVDKQLAVSQDGGEVVMHRFNQQQELVDKIRGDKQNRRSVAVLVRTNSKKALLADQLYRAGVRVKGATPLMERPVTSRMLTVLKMVRESDNHLFSQYYYLLAPNLNRAVASKFVKSGTPWAAAALSNQLDMKESVITVMKEILASESLVESLNQVILLLKNTFDYWVKKGMLYESELYEELNYLLLLAEGCDYRTFYDKLLIAKKGLESEVSDEAVQFLTLHAVKGLEFDSVYLYLLDDRDCFNILSSEWEMKARIGGQDYDRYVLDIFNSLAESNSEGLCREAVESERRLFYVGCTRAKKRLTVVVDPLRPCTVLKECLLNQGKASVNLI